MSNAIPIGQVQSLGQTQSQEGRDSTRSLALRNVESASPFSGIAAFEAAQRMAVALTSSTMVPSDYQGRENLGNALIALEVAQRTQSSILAVMQNLYVVHGRPGWSGQYVIAAINQSGKFAEPIHFEFVGEEGKDSWGCYVTAITKTGRVIKGPTITIALAKLEGWYGKPGSKWKTIPELMLRYRAGSWFGKTECPEILMGMPTSDEVREVIDIDKDGKIIRDGDPRVVTVETLQQEARRAAAPAAAVEEENFIDDEVAARREKELAERGYWQSGESLLSEDGEVWNPEIHATSSETGGPIVNEKDRAFRKRRGVSDTVVAQVKAQEAEAGDSNEGDDEELNLE